VPSPSGQHGTSVDMPGRRHPSSSFICWAGDVVLPRCHHCWGGFGGGSDDEVEVVVAMVVWWPLLLM